MLDRSDHDTDGATFYVPGKVHEHNVRSWVTEILHIVREQIRDSPKVNVWLQCTTEVLGHSFSKKQQSAWISKPDMLPLYSVTQVQYLEPTILQKRRPHWVYHDGRSCTRNFREIVRQRRPTLLVSSFHGHNTTGLLHVRLCQEHCLPITIHRNWWPEADYPAYS